MKSAFFGLLALFGALIFAAIIFKLAQPAPRYYSQAEDVVLYSAQWCGYCTQARNYLTRQKIPFTELDIEKSDIGRQQYAAFAVSGIPLLNVKGTLVRGFNPSAITQALEQPAAH